MSVYFDIGLIGTLYLSLSIFQFINRIHLTFLTKVGLSQLRSSQEYQWLPPSEDFWTLVTMVIAESLSCFSLPSHSRKCFCFKMLSQQISLGFKMCMVGIQRGRASLISLHYSNPRGTFIFMDLISIDAMIFQAHLFRRQKWVNIHLKHSEDIWHFAFITSSVWSPLHFIIPN